MQPQLCSRCKKNIAVVFITRQENGQNVNEGLGLNSDAKEAVAFAVLANEAMAGRCNNAPSATGAAHPVVMGKISF